MWLLIGFSGREVSRGAVSHQLKIDFSGRGFSGGMAALIALGVVGLKVAAPEVKIELATSAYAQDSPATKSELNDLARDVEALRRAIANTKISGESGEAARLTVEQQSLRQLLGEFQRQLANIESRLAVLEGSIEENQRAITLNQNQLERLANDLNFRLDTIEGTNRGEPNLAPGAAASTQDNATRTRIHQQKPQNRLRRGAGKPHQRS